MRLSELVGTIDIFEDLLPEDQLELAGLMRSRTLPAGQKLCTNDEPYDGLFAVVDGCVEIETSAHTTQRLNRGDAWGDVNLISHESTPCTATALVDSQVVELDRDGFDAFITARPVAMRSILAAVSRRAVLANQRLLADDSRETGHGPKGRIYAIFSTKGGSGKTLLAVRLALEFTRRTQGRAALVDLDLLFDDAAMELELSGASTLGRSAGEQQPVLAELLTRHASGLAVLVATDRPEDGERVTPAHVRAALTGLKRQFVATVVDCASTYSEPTLAALEMADCILVICTPELTTLRDLREMQRLFGQALHVNKQRVSFVLNHPSPSAGLTRQQFERGLEQRVLLEVDHAGEDASRPMVARAVAQLADELDPLHRRQKQGAGRFSLLGRKRHGS